MELVYQDKYVTRYYYPEYQILAEYWSDTTLKMSDEEFILAEKEFENAFILYKPRKLLSQLQKFQYPITPEIQDWIKETVAKTSVENGVRFKADVFNKTDISNAENFDGLDINQMSVEQLMDDVIETMSMEYKAFDNEEEAMQWLISK